MAEQASTKMSVSDSGDAARMNMQKKTFTTWVNLHLGKQGLKIADLKTDFADGIALLKLVEQISEETLGKYNKKPISKFQKVENINIPIKYINDFIKAQKITNQYSAENILEENETLILGMVWSLILRFAVNEISEGDRTAKEGLLLWAQKKVEEASKGKVKVTNFHTSWQDGTAFCSLIQAYRPDLINYASVKPSTDAAERSRTLDMAFDTAAEHFGIPKMLDAADMCSTRPDEKSVMTYVSFFWKEFASTKKKALAAERIAAVVSREQVFETMQSTFEEQSRNLASWLETTTSRLKAGPDVKSGDLEATLEAFVEYNRTERPKRIAELAEVEGLYASITSRLDGLGRSYSPPSDCDLAALRRWFEELTMAEQTYEEGIKASLGNVKRMGHLIRLFNSKASKLEAWLGAKAAWLQASQDVCRQQLGGEPTSPDGGGGGGGGGTPRARDPTLAPPPGVPGSAAGAAGAAGAGGAATATASTPDLPLGGDEGTPETKTKRASFFGDLFNAISETVAGSTPADSAGGAKTGLGLDERLDAAGTPLGLGEESSAQSSTTPASALRTARSQEIFVSELAVQTRRVSMGPSGLDSVSAVLAKINMFKAYEDEQASRKEAVTQLERLPAQLQALEYAHVERLSERCAEIRASVAGLEEAAASYRAALDEVLKQQQSLDDERLAFAKRAEALNRWIEENTDAMSEVMGVDNAKEAEAVDAELATFKEEEASHTAELASLTTFASDLSSKGAGVNPYSRFRIEELEAALRRCHAAADERARRLMLARERLKELDEQKRQFAQAAEAALEYLGAEKAMIEAQTRGARPIRPDDAEAIAAGTERLAALHAYSARASERAEQLSRAQELSDGLMAAAEMDNPYTRQSLASLTSAFDAHEKHVRDQATLVEGQLARAQADITPEQHAELKEAFEHFDHSKDGALNQIEFSAAMKSLDFEGEAIDAEFKQRATTKVDSEGGQVKAVAFDAFLTIVLQQYKDKDTMEGLLSAFRTLSNGKDAIPEAELTDPKFLQPADATYLQARLKAAEGGGFEYMAFTNSVYPNAAAPTIS